MISPHISWTLVHKRAKIRPSFYLPFINYACCFITAFAHKAYQTEMNRNFLHAEKRAKFAIRRYNFESPVAKMRPKTAYMYVLAGLGLNREYLQEVSWHRRSQNGFGDHKKPQHSPKFHELWFRNGQKCELRFTKFP